MTEQLVGGLRVDGVDAIVDLGPQLLQRERGLPRVGRGRLFRFSDRVAQLGEAGFQQSVDGGNDQMGVVAQRERADAGAGCQDLRNFRSEDCFEAWAMLGKTTRQLDFAGAILVKAAYQLLGRGAAEQRHEDDLLDVQVVLDDPVAKGVAGSEGPASLLPAQAVGDALAYLRGQTLQHLVGREPAELDEHGSHLVAARLGLREQVGELPLVNDLLGTKQGSQSLLAQVRVGSDDPAVAQVDLFPHLAAGQGERTGLAPVGQVDEQLGHPSLGQGSGWTLQRPRGRSRWEEAHGFRRFRCGGRLGRHRHCLRDGP